MDQLLHKQLNLLAHLAKIDGKFHQSERTLLQSLLEERGLIDRFIEERPAFNLSELGEVHNKKELLYWSLKMIQADGVIHPDERAYCKMLALKFGFQSESIDAFAEHFAMSYLDFANAVEKFRQ